MASDLTVHPAMPLPFVAPWKFLLPLWKIRSGDFSAAVGFTQRMGAFRTQVGPFRFIVANDPELVEEVLVKRHKYYHKDPGYAALTRVLGNGLLTSEEEFHLRQRRLIQPAFHRQRIAQYAECMVGYAREMSRSWQDGATMEITEQMSSVTLSIIGKTMFSAEVGGAAHKVANALETFFRYHELFQVPVIGRIFERLPIPAARRFKHALSDLNATMNEMIQSHLHSEEDMGDLLSMLLMARDEEDGGKMNMQQVHDEAITLFLAGHETTSLAMTWTWYLLSSHPDIEARLHAELDEVLGNRDATYEDVEKLVYTRRVFTESMRLYPPAWGFGRQAMEAHELGPHKVRKGQLVVMSPFMMHRMPKWYENPETFDPDRWLPERCAHLPKFAYMPFGGGVRKCIGEPFAWMEGILLLATFAQEWKLRLSPDARIGLDPKITLRPKWGMPMSVHRREGR